MIVKKRTRPFLSRVIEAMRFMEQRVKAFFFYAPRPQNVFVLSVSFFLSSLSQQDQRLHRSLLCCMYDLSLIVILASPPVFFNSFFLLLGLFCVFRNLRCQQNNTQNQFASFYCCNVFCGLAQRKKSMADKCFVDLFFCSLPGAFCDRNSIQLVFYLRLKRLLQTS